MKRSKRILISLLVALMLVTSVPLSGLVGLELPSGTDLFSQKASALNVKSELDSFISKYPNGSRWTGTFDGSIQCHGFGRMVMYNIFGKNSSGGYRSWNYAGVSSSGMKSLGSITNFSYSNVQSLLNSAKCGDILQFNTTKQHTMVVYSVESDGVYVYDCNWDNNCGISLRKCSFGAWSGRNSSKLTLLRADNYPETDYTLSFNANGGSGSMSSITAKYEEYFMLPANSFTNDGYDFAGWYLKRNDDDKWFVSSVGWKNEWEIPYDGHEKSEYPNQWYNSVDWSWINGNDSATSFTFYAIWKPKTYTIGFNSNGGEGNTVSISSKYKEYFTLPANSFKKAGYNFDGWNLKRNDDGKWFVSSIGWKNEWEIPFNGNGKSFYPNQWHSWVDYSWINGNENATNFTFYATWTPKTYTINFDANGGSGSMASITKVYGDARSELPKSTFTRAGYEFAGWNLKRNTDSKWFVSNIGWKNESDIPFEGNEKNVYMDQWNCFVDYSWISGNENATDFTLYAVWIPKTYTINFDANGGSGSMASITNVYCDDESKLQKNTFTKAGYEFAGWNLKRNSDEKWFVPNIGWLNEWEIPKDGNDKLVYPDEWHYWVDSSWISGNENATDFTFYAVWEKVQTHTHSYTSTVTKPATCSEVGIKTFKCTCGDSYTQQIAKLPHTDKIITGHKPACSEVGLTDGKVCSVCGLTIQTQEIIPATGKHVDGNKDGICDECGIETDSNDNTKENCSCICHKGGFSGFIYKIIRVFWKLFKINPTCDCGVAHY